MRNRLLKRRFAQKKSIYICETHLKEEKTPKWGNRLLKRQFSQKNIYM